MENKSKIKAGLLNELVILLEQKIALLKQDIASTKESRDIETKSSAGDKYETGRAMMQMELDKNNDQLNKYLILKKELLHIDLKKLSSQVEFGSLAVTTSGNYFIAVAMSKIEVNNEIYYPISLASPIGHALLNKKVNDSIDFNGKIITITLIV